MSVLVCYANRSLLVKLIRQINLTCDTFITDFPHYCNFIWHSIALGCCDCKCRQVLSCSSSSQIPGTCDSQACCCCGDLNMVLCMFLPPLAVVWVPPHVNTLAKVVVVVVCLLLTTVTYGKLYLTMRRHKNQIQSLQLQQVAQPGDMTNTVNAIKSAVGIFYVYLLFLVCYLPFFVCVVAIRINGPSISLYPSPR